MFNPYVDPYLEFTFRTGTSLTRDLNFPYVASSAVKVYVNSDLIIADSTTYTYERSNDVHRVIFADEYLQDGDEVRIERVTPITQAQDFTVDNVLRAENVQAGLDKLTAVLQEVAIDFEDIGVVPRIDALETSIQTVSDDLQAFETRYGFLLDPDNALSPYFLASDIADTNTRLNALDALIENLQGDTSTNARAITGLTNRLSTYNQFRASTITSLNDISTRIANLDTELGTINTDLSNEITNIRSSISNALRDVENFKTRLATQDQTIANIIPQLSNLSTYQTAVNTLDANFKILDIFTRGSVDSLTMKFNEACAKIDDLERELRTGFDNLSFLQLTDTPSKFEANKLLGTDPLGCKVIYVDPATLGGGGGGGSGGSSNFLGLTDTPLSYNTEKDAEVVVNSNEDGLTFSKVQNLPRVTQLEDEDIFKVTDFIKGEVTPPVGTALSDLDLSGILTTPNNLSGSIIFDTDNPRYAYIFSYNNTTDEGYLHKIDLTTRTIIASTPVRLPPGNRHPNYVEVSTSDSELMHADGYIYSTSTANNRVIVRIRDDLSGVFTVLRVTNSEGVTSANTGLSQGVSAFFTSNKLYIYTANSPTFTEFGIGSNPGSNPLSIPTQLRTTPLYIHKNGDILYFLYPHNDNRNYDVKAMRFSTGEYLPEITGTLDFGSIPQETLSTAHNIVHNAFTPSGIVKRYSVAIPNTVVTPDTYEPKKATLNDVSGYLDNKLIASPTLKPIGDEDIFKVIDVSKTIGQRLSSIPLPDTPGGFFRNISFAVDVNNDNIAYIYHVQLDDTETVKGVNLATGSIISSTPYMTHRNFPVAVGTSLYTFREAQLLRTTAGSSGTLTQVPVLNSAGVVNPVELNERASTIIGNKLYIMRQSSLNIYGLGRGVPSTELGRRLYTTSFSEPRTDDRYYQYIPERDLIYAVTFLDATDQIKVEAMRFSTLTLIPEYTHTFTPTGNYPTLSVSPVITADTLYLLLVDNETNSSSSQVYRYSLRSVSDVTYLPKKVTFGDIKEEITKNLPSSGGGTAESTNDFINASISGSVITLARRSGSNPVRLTLPAQTPNDFISARISGNQLILARRNGQTIILNLPAQTPQSTNDFINARISGSTLTLERRSGSSPLVLNLPTPRTTFTSLNDVTPTTLSGQGGKHLAVNSAGNSIELVDAPTGGGTSSGDPVDAIFTVNETFSSSDVQSTYGGFLNMASISTSDGSVINSRSVTYNGDTLTGVLLTPGIYAVHVDMNGTVPQNADTGEILVSRHVNSTTIAVEERISSDSLDGRTAGFAGFHLGETYITRITKDEIILFSATFDPVAASFTGSNNILVDGRISIAKLDATKGEKGDKGDAGSTSIDNLSLADRLSLVRLSSTHLLTLFPQGTVSTEYTDMRFQTEILHPGLDLTGATYTIHGQSGLVTVLRDNLVLSTTSQTDTTFLAVNIGATVLIGILNNVLSTSGSEAQARTANIRANGGYIFLTIAKAGTGGFNLHVPLLELVPGLPRSLDVFDTTPTVKSVTLPTNYLDYELITIIGTNGNNFFPTTITTDLLSMFNNRNLVIPPGANRYTFNSTTRVLTEMSNMNSRRIRKVTLSAPKG